MCKVFPEVPLIDPHFIHTVLSKEDGKSYATENGQQREIWDALREKVSEEVVIS